MQFNKELYQSYLKCPREFYFMVNKENAQPKHEMRQHYDNMEKEVIKLAQGLLSGGTDAHHSHDETLKLINDGQNIIYNARFISDKYDTSVDIIVRSGQGYDIYCITREESSDFHSFVNKQSKKGLFKKFAANLTFTKYSLVDMGFKINKSLVIAVNKFYKRGKELDITKLFDILDISAGINIARYTFPKDIEKMNHLVNDVILPNTSISKGKCLKPQFNECLFSKYCWKDIPKDSIHDIPKISSSKIDDCIKSNKIMLESVLEDAMSRSKEETKIKKLIDFTDKQKMLIKRALRTKTSENLPQLFTFVNDLVYPLYHWDLETFAKIIPPYENTMPYENIPFQFSLHIEQKNEEVTHIEFLDTSGNDPREDLIKSLISNMGESGSIIVYNMGFESVVLQNLAMQFPKYEKELMALKDRLVDLFEPFQSNYYYHPDMKFSNALKSVYPALIGDAYKNLTINNGLSAMAAYFTIQEQVQNRIMIDEDLRKYCFQDTYSMIEILRYLKNVLIHAGFEIT